MKRLFALSCCALALTLLSCKDDFDEYIIPNGQIYSCNVDGKSAYLVSAFFDDSQNEDDNNTPRPSTNEGRLYFDNGELYADPVPVVLQTRNDEVFISGDDIEFQSCDLAPYEGLPKVEQDKLPMDYCTPKYAVNVVHDIVYGYADGYWASYPDTYEDFGTIFLRKFAGGDLLFRQRLPLTMDVYLPDDDAPSDFRRPLLVMIHGGGFFNGDKADEEYRQWCRMFAECGYTAVSINYRLGFSPVGLTSGRWCVGRAAYRAVQDARAAVAFLLDNEEEYRIDPKRIFLAGCSAGAITALNAAYMDTKTRPEGCCMVGDGLIDGDLGLIDQVAFANGHTQDFEVRAIGNMWGGVFDLSILERPYRAKILSIQSTLDPVVPANTDYPFKVIYRKAPLMVPLLDILTPKISGSTMIESLHREGDKFQYFMEERHTLIRYNSTPEDHSLNERHKEFFDSMTQFFHDNMMKYPARLDQYDNGGQTFAVFHMFSPMEPLNWKVQGGVITAHDDGDEDVEEIKALLFSDARKHRIIVDGMYSCGLEYKDTLEVAPGAKGEK